MKSISQGGSLLLLAFLCGSHAVADTYPRQPGIDAQHYIFRLILSDDSNEISGETTVDLRFVRDGVTEIALDLASVANDKDRKSTRLNPVT